MKQVIINTDGIKENAGYEVSLYFGDEMKLTSIKDAEGNRVEEAIADSVYEPYKGVTIEQSIDSIPLTSSMFGQGYYDYDKIVKGMSIQQTPLGTDATAFIPDSRVNSTSTVGLPLESRISLACTSIILISNDIFSTYFPVCP